MRCLALSREALTNILGDKIQVIMYNNLMKWAIEKNPILGKLTKIQIEKIVANSKQVTYQKNQSVFTAGQKCEKLVLLLEGALITESDQRVIVDKG